MTKIRWNELVFGKRKDPNDPAVHKHISLVAFLAWVGLGADGLSSACYGPEETFKALENYRYLAPWLVVATVVTVSVLSAAYSSTIMAFPSGGGGYSVATRTLGRHAGMICGCALVLDYILTVGISVAAGAKAIFSMVPEHAHYKIYVALAGTVLLMVMNFRGVKDSVTVLMPIFVLFLLTHAVLIAMAIFAPSVKAPAEVAAANAAPLATWAAAQWIIKAFSRGAGTYTGIEAISNSLTILREPRVRTARHAMIYMAASLSIVAGGLLIGYMRMDVRMQGDKSFNAILAQTVFGPGVFGKAMVPLTLASEAVLLFVAAQAGFIDGPRVLASMAVDSWVPRWFSRLSDRLTVSNGVLLIGLGGIASILVTDCEDTKLVVIYSFSVFVTFMLSQAGMIRYWFQHREGIWYVRATISILAAAVSATVLVALLVTHNIAWAGGTLAAIVVLALLCTLVKRHYARVGRSLARLEGLIQAAESDPHHEEQRPWDKNAPTAVFLVSGYNGPGMHTVLGLQRIFPGYFHQMIFASVGTVDFDRFKGQAEVENLKASVGDSLDRYVRLVQRWGYAAEARSTFGVDAIEELDELCGKIAGDCPRSVFFCGDLIFQMPSALTRVLHERTAEELQRRIRSRGLPLIVIPIRV